MEMAQDESSRPDIEWFIVVQSRLISIRFPNPVVTDPF